MVHFQVKSKKDLLKIINHFDEASLITQKLADYNLFKQAFRLIQCKEHLTKEGLRKILSIRASMNNGLTDTLRTAFPGITPVQRPNVQNQKINDPEWLAGFASLPPSDSPILDWGVGGGLEGSFMVDILKSPACRTGFQVRLVFELAQHSRDEQLMRSLVDFLGCGKSSIVVPKLLNSRDIHKIEREMDNRGSKLCSDVSFTPGLIKEQRLDGSLQVSGVSCLRCSLTGLEINYKVKVPSKQINKVRFYSTMMVDQTQKLIINPWFITGFSDGEGCFMLIISKNQTCSTG